jgi:hypothetical protein
MLGGGITLTHRHEVADEGDRTVLRHEFSAFGPISDEMADGIERHGSLETFEAQRRSWIERGEVIPPPES